MSDKFIVHFSEVERNKIVELSQHTLWNESSEDVVQALQYLREERKLPDNVIKRFRIGYFPQRLRKAGHDWAGRLIMPLYDSHDKLVVLTSRDFRADKNGMPHLHEEFDKKLFLYGSNVAKSHIVRWQKAIVVEGQVDTAASHANGFEITVGILGSAFTINHVCILARYCSDIFLAFDADESGFGNLARSMTMYKKNGLDSFGLKFIPVVFPKYKDPDEFLAKESRQAYLNLLSEAKAGTDKLGSIGYYELLREKEPHKLKGLK